MSDALRIISHDNSNPDLAAYWADMAHRLFWNVNALYEQIEIQYADRSPEEGPGAQMAVSANGTYGLVSRMLTGPWTGILRLYVWLFGVLCVQVSEQQVQPSSPRCCQSADTNVPSVCLDQSLTRNAPAMVQRTLNILNESKSIWPLASRWLDHLDKFYKSKNAVAAGTEGSMADSVSVYLDPLR